MVMKPPSGGPTTGPISAGVVSQAIAAMSSDFGTRRSSNSRPTGTIIAPPMPCSTRNSTSAGKDCAAPHSTEPRVNTAMAMRKTLRAP